MQSQAVFTTASGSSTQPLKTQRFTRYEHPAAENAMADASLKSGALPTAEKHLAELLKQLSSAPAGLSKVADDYARIFVGPAALPAPPWESVYRDNKRMLMTATTLSVRERYRSYGYEARRILNVPDDHLAIELDFLSALAQLVVFVR